MDLNQKYEALQTNIRALGRVAVAFSGGVDSTLLLAVAADGLGTNAFAITAKTPFSPQADYQEAIDFCAAHNIQQQVISVDVLAHADIVANTSERCYLCKRAIFEAIDQVAKAENAIVVDGSNADDSLDYRPGKRALRELDVVSPLAEVGLTKEEVRELSRRLALPTAEKPANACLATRIPTDTPISGEVLHKIDEAEHLLNSLGIEGSRVRVHGDVARIEVAPADIERLVQEPLRTDIIDGFKEIGFRYVSLDLAGYRMGNMN